MRHLKVAALGLLATALLVSCYWVGNFGKGGLTLEVPKMQAKAAGDVVRVYLLADGKLFSTGGGVPFCAEVVAQSDTTQISIQGLPVGPQYQALVGVGTMSGGFFDVSNFGSSSLFSISPNADTAVTVNTQYLDFAGSISFALELLGKNLKGVTYAGSYAYTAEDSRIYACDSSGLIQAQYDFSYVINSLSADRGQLSTLLSAAFINSNIGVLPFNYSAGWNFQTDFSSTLSGPKDILESGSFMVGADYALLFRRADGLGGTYVNQLAKPTPTSWTWVNVDVAGVLDMALGTENAYFATEGGAFGLPPAFLSTPDLAQRIPFSAPGKIQSLGWIPGGAAAPKIIMGTTSGVYESDVDEATGSFTNLVPITDSSGNSIQDSIIMVELYPSSPDSYQAYLSRYWLYIRKTGYGTIYRLPFFAVIPGRATGMAWDSSWRLYISGTEGLSVINVGS
jgi:hypothetical protein